MKIQMDDELIKKENTEVNLKNGRDFVILEQFYQIILEKNKANKEQAVLIDELLLPFCRDL